MQHDYDINSSDAISGLQFRQDVNNVLSAIKSSNSGATAPTTYIAGTIWLDTSTTPHILKKRNTANTGWDTIRIEDALGAPIASGATTTVGAYSGGNTVHITGTTTITSLGVSTTGTTRHLIFDSALTITHNATSLICPNGLSITTVTGDAITVICEDGALGYWKVSSISRLMPSELALIINSATAKTTPVDADLFGIVDSAASNVLKKLSCLDLKATLKTYFDTIYASYVYAQITSSVTGITGTTFAGATNIVTAPAISPNGTDYYEIEFYAQTLINTVAGAKTYFMLSRGGIDMGIIGGGAAPSSLGPNNYCKQVMVLPSGANIIYSIVAYVSSGSGTVAAGTGGAGNNMPTFLKITKL